METPVLDQLTAEELKTKLKEDGAKLHEYRNAATTAKETRETAETEWRNEPDVKAIFEAETQAVTVRDQAETNIRLMQTRLYELTGEKNPDPAFQVRIVEKPVYEADKVTDWLLDMLRGLMTLNKTAVNSWLKKVADPSGNMPVWFQKPIPAIVINETTTAIVSAGLERLATKPIPSQDEAADPDGLKPNGIVVELEMPTSAADKLLEMGLNSVQDRINVLLKQDAHVPELVPVDLEKDKYDIPF